MRDFIQCDVEHEDPKSFDLLVNGWISESDRGCVLIAAAYLDELLERLLRAQFPDDNNCVKKAVDPLFQIMGPLSSFSAKIKLAFALQLVDACHFSDLEIIRIIRNKFAHSYYDVTFANQEIADKTSCLKSSDFASMKMEPLDLASNEGSSEQQITISKEKMRFVFAVSYMAGYLQSRIDQIASEEK